MIDRIIALFTTGPVGSAVAWSGWRRARAGCVEKLVEIELVVDEKPCAAGRLSCGPTSAADCCTTYASNRRIQWHETMLKNCYRLRSLLDAAQGCSSETLEALAKSCSQFARRKAVKTSWRCELAACKGTREHTRLDGATGSIN